MAFSKRIYECFGQADPEDVGSVIVSLSRDMAHLNKTMIMLNKIIQPPHRGDSEPAQLDNLLTNADPFLNPIEFINQN